MTAKPQRHHFVFEVDQHELACRIAEAQMGIDRPPGQSAKEALAGLQERFPVQVKSWYAAAHAASTYLMSTITTQQAQGRAEVSNEQ